MICTDPPYYDNIGYADLSDFFYVWLRRSLGAIYPDLFSTLLTPKTARSSSRLRTASTASREQADAFFEEDSGQHSNRCVNAQHPSYPLTLFYAFKQAESTDGS